MFKLPVFSVVVAVVCCSVSAIGQPAVQPADSNNTLPMPILAVTGVAASETAQPELPTVPTDTTLTLLPETISDSPPDKPEPAVDSAAEFIPFQEYTFAGNQRYTVDASLPRRTSKINPITTTALGVAYGGLIYGLHVLQSNAWWKDNRQAFHFQDDWDYALQVDKIGHAFGGYYMSYILGEGVQGCGFSVTTSRWLGATLGFLYQTYVEVEDGYGAQWGFSPTDFAGDFLGAAYFMAQHYVPALENFNLKWEYVPAQWVGERTVRHPTAVVDDYNSSTFWLSANVHNLLPENLKSYWPSWLNLALGYGVRDISYDDPTLGADFQMPKRRFIIGLDYDFVRLMPDGPNFWNWVRQGMNWFKIIPAPAISFGDEGTRFYLLYPFKFDVGGVRF